MRGDILSSTLAKRDRLRGLDLISRDPLPLHDKRVEIVGQELTVLARSLAGLSEREHRSLAEPHPGLPAIAIVAQYP